MTLARHEDVRRTARAYNISLEEAEKVVAEEAVHAEKDGDIDIYDLCDHYCSVSDNY